MASRIRWKDWDFLIIGATFLVLTLLVKMHRLTDFVIFCIFVLAYDLLYGYMGRLSFGHMLYFGTGAYAAALYARHLTSSLPLVLLLAMAAGTLIGVLVGPVVIRTTSSWFALMNLALNQVGYFLTLTAFARYTGGEDGLSLSLDPPRAVEPG